MTEELQVTQADRDAAKAAALDVYYANSDVLCGADVEEMEGVLANAFARHRIASTPTGDVEAVKEAIVAELDRQHIAMDEFSDPINVSALARAALSALSTPVEGWREPREVPYNTPVRVKVGKGMTFIARMVPDAGMTEDEQFCDQWEAEHEGEHPECWSDGCCWTSNADESPSMPVRGWQPLPPPPGTETMT